MSGEENSTALVVATPTSTNPRGGRPHRNRRDRGDGRGGRGGNDDTRGDRRHTRSNRTPNTSLSKFKGDTSDMNGHVFQCHSETSDAKQFSVSLEKLQHYVFKHFKNPTDIGGIFKELKIPEVPRPTKPDPPSTRKTQLRLPIMRSTYPFLLRM